MTVVTLRGTTHAVASASTREGSDPSRMVALALLSLRFIQGFIYWGGGSRRFIYAPSKLDPHAASWMANKFQSAMPGALLGTDGAALSHLPPSMIANEFAYNRFVPGPFGLSAKMGAEATITLPGMATAGTDVPGKAATLRLRTVNGTSFELSLTSYPP
jgi:hypothetical protein